VPVRPSRLRRIKSQPSDRRASASVRETRVESWADLQESLFEGSWRDSLQRHRSRFAFRGCPTLSDSLVTRLALVDPSSERHLLRNFRKFARAAAVPGDSLWNWLALAQHHGLPTRLLDWTFSPFVALHFATDHPADFERDGLVWCVDYVATHRLLPSRLRKVLGEESADVFTGEMLGRVAGTLEALDRLSRKPFLLFLDPPSVDERIVNQYALFSLLSAPARSLEGWIAEHPGLARRIVIPAALKWEVRDKLDQANVTERVLFPGLDGLSRWLERYYMPRERQAPNTTGPRLR
jgi:hypothetical protein